MMPGVHMVDDLLQLSRQRYKQTVVHEPLVLFDTPALFIETLPEPSVKSREVDVCQ